jgi:hypothetical protein
MGTPIFQRSLEVRRPFWKNTVAIDVRFSFVWRMFRNFKEEVEWDEMGSERRLGEV